MRSRMVFAASVIAGLSSSMAAQAAVLLQDNFTAIYTNDPATYDINQNLAVRQAGSSLGTVNWEKMGPGNATQVGNGGNYLLLANTGRAVLRHNFNGTAAAGGMTIAFDVKPHTDASNTTKWTAISLGMSEGDRGTYVNGAPAHFGILFRANGGWQTFDGEVVKGEGTDLSLKLNTFTPVKIVITDPTDNNPFNGLGQTDIAVFINNSSTPALTYSKAGGYADNYINFHAADDIGAIDNLVISSPIPEPTSLAAIAALGGLLMRRRRPA